MNLEHYKWIYDPRTQGTFTHAQVPKAILVNDRLRILFAGRIRGKAIYFRSTFHVMVVLTSSQIRCVSWDPILV